LLAIELAYFRTNPLTATDEVRHQYYLDYEQAAEKLIFGHAKDLDDLGWRMRWGVTVDAVNRAMRAEIGFTADALISGTANELMYVIFNVNHDYIMDESGYCLRKLGRK
ncbi:hypothetical protein HGB25_02655, partial [Candidatus Saccharibacteria bacterium]|nr:hypothetical protein [Candidatus Saccharibacteria bacterium]